MKIVIIEDEPAIARNLEFLIHEIDEAAQVINKLSSVNEAVKWLKLHRDDCDLLFMDIRLSDGLSFEIFDTISPSVPIVFVTAYEDFALDAFKVNAIDYILKPFEKADLEAALNKFKNLTKTDFTHKFLDFFNYYKQNLENKVYKQSYLVHYKNKLIPLNLDDIGWFYTEKEIVYAHTIDGGKYIIDSTLEKVYSEIDPLQFFRANRQYIVHRKFISDVDFYFNGRLIINISPKPTEKIIVSKVKAPEFKRWLNQ